MERDTLINASRMVVKFGTGILTNRSKQIDPGQIEQLVAQVVAQRQAGRDVVCLLYTSPSPRDATLSRMPSSA